MPRAAKFEEAYNNYSPKELKKHHDECLSHYLINKGEASVKVLSRIGQVPQRVVRKWIADEHWIDKVVTKADSLPAAINGEALKSKAEELKLTDQEEAFCYYYLKSYNATNAAMKAGYSPNSCYNMAYHLMKKSNVVQFIEYLKKARNDQLMVEATDIVSEYMRIAFADITDYLTFGPSGVQLKHSSGVDGRLIVEIKEGRDGVSIKLADKMKALEKLSKYLDVFEDEAIKTKILKHQLAMIEGEEDNEPLEIHIIRKGENDED